MQKKVVIIGCGFSGLSAACFMAKGGWDVTVIEKHDLPGGRARKFTEQGFTFDMGPSWYWMPDVFDRFFQQFGKSYRDYYSLTRLDPSYKIFWKDGQLNIPAHYDELKHLFETIEPGSAKLLDKFITEAAYKYTIGIEKLVYKPGLSISEVLDRDIIKHLGKLDVFRSMKAHVARYFKNPKLQQLLEFPVLFLGAMPSNIPALYSLMNYADIIGGTWYPKGGIYKVVEAMYSLALSLGVSFSFSEEVKEIVIGNRKAKQVFTQSANGPIKSYSADAVIGSADYHFIEQKLLNKEHRSYTEEYWDKRVMAPGCLLYYVGLNKKLPQLTHHSLFFDADFSLHGNEIYSAKKWPTDPLFYMSATSVTDSSVAPAGCENLFLLIPVAAGLSDDSTEVREKYFDLIITRAEKHLQTGIKDSIVYKRSFGYTDFVKDYNSFKGNAYGLANTLLQTFVLKPKCRSKKVSNLFYTGQLTVPGPGVPPSLISGEVVAKEVMKTIV